MLLGTWAVLGALLGLSVNALMRGDDRLARVLRVIIGVGGAICGGLLVVGAAQAWQMGLDGLTFGGALAAMASASMFLLLARLARITG